MAQRERRRIVEPAHARVPQEGGLLHGPARRDGRRRAQVARALLRDDHGAAVDGARGRGRVELPVRFVAAHIQRQGLGGLTRSSSGTGTSTATDTCTAPWHVTRARATTACKWTGTR